MNSTHFARSYLRELGTLLEHTSDVDIGQVLDLLAKAHDEHRTLFLAGNGGSAATASHMANDLSWGLTRAGIRPFRTVCLSDCTPLLTAIANDTGYEEVFSRQLEALADEGSVLVAISGSGNSPNILHALETAKRLRLTTIGFLGMDGGRARAMVDASIVIPSMDYGPIEDVHMVLDHLVTAYLRMAQKR